MFLGTWTAGHKRDGTTSTFPSPPSTSPWGGEKDHQYEFLWGSHQKKDSFVCEQLCFQEGFDFFWRIMFKQFECYRAFWDAAMSISYIYIVYMYILYLFIIYICIFNFECYIYMKYIIYKYEIYCIYMKYIVYIYEIYLWYIVVYCIYEIKKYIYYIMYIHI